MSRRDLAILLALTFLAAALRFALGVHGGDLWLDEAWTALIARDAAATGQSVLAEPYRVDNNHPLMTWLILVLGPDRQGWVFRTAVWLPTCLLPPLAFLAAKPFGRPAQWTVCLWAGLAFPFTVYGTEARGYGFALVAAFAALLLTQSHRPTPARLLTYHAVAVLALLAHFTFTHALATLIALTALRQWQHVKSAPVVFRTVLLWHGPPLLAAVLLYVGFLRHVKVAGGPASDILSAALGAASLSLSLPWEGPVALALGAATLLATAVAVWHCRSESLACIVPVAWIAALTTVLLKGVLHGQAEVLFPRYFLVTATLSTFVLVAAAARAWTAAPPRLAQAVRGVLCGVAILLVAAAILQHFFFHTLGGRGHYLAPLTTIANSLNPTLSSDYHSRTQRLENYYRPRLPRRITYLSPDTSPIAPEWLLLNSSTTVPHPPPTTLTHLGQTYRLTSTHPHHGPSGWTWYLYRLTSSSG